MLYYNDALKGKNLKGGVMVSIMFRLVLLVFVSSGIILAQSPKIKWTGETEFTQSQKGQQSYDLYVFGSHQKFELLARYFKVENGLERGEFGIGKSFAFANNRLIVTPSIGYTTDKAIFIPFVFVTQVSKRTLVYVIDPKIYPGKNTNTLYQELSAGLTKKGGWQFRWEALQVGTFRLYHRLGIERRIWVTNGNHFHVSPWYDPTNDQVGFYAGFRFR